MAQKLLLIDDNTFFATQLCDHSMLAGQCCLDLIEVNSSYQRVLKKIEDEKYDWVIFSDNYEGQGERDLTKELLAIQGDLKIAIIKSEPLIPKKINDRIHFITSKSEPLDVLAKKIFKTIHIENNNPTSLFKAKHFPKPQHFSACSDESKNFLSQLWQQVKQYQNLFIIHPSGSEIGLISKEISAWFGNSDGFDFINFNYLTTPSLRVVINDAERSNGQRNVIVVRNLHEATDRQKARVVARVLSENPKTSNLRLIFLIESQLVSTGKNGFSSDLFNLIKTRGLTVPQLSNRLADISEYTQRYYKILSKSDPKQYPTWTPEAIGLFLQYPWPGNFAELIDAIDFLVSTTNSKSITARIIEEYFLKNEKLVPLGGYSLNEVIKNKRNELLKTELSDAFSDLKEYMQYLEA